MRKYSFANWIAEYADYGLDTSANQPTPIMANQDYPLQPLNVEYIIKSLKKKSLGEKWSIPNDFFGELQWGENDGSVRLSFSSLGGLRAIIRKLTHDLQGDPVWICKDVIEVKHKFDEYPDKLSFKIEESLVKFNNENIEAPNGDYKDFERFVINLASVLRRKTTQKIFMYEGIRVVSEGHKYIIHFGVSGMGVQSRGQKRLDQFSVQAEYSNKTGLIKIAGTELGDDIAQHRWIYRPSQFIEYFSPFQSEEEICNAILTHFNCY